MDPLKSVADVVEHVLYETLGLLLPGALLLVGVAAAVGGETFQQVLAAAGAHPWLSILAAYLAGYVVQGVSRPLVGAAAWLLRLPGRGLVGALPHGVRQRVRQWEATVAAGRHAHAGEQPGESRANLEEVEQRYWETRLGVRGPLSKAQLRDLAFSELLAERKQLDRFRAATSFCRGSSVAAVAVLVIVAWQLLTGARDVSISGFALIVGAVVTFYALLERADMYDRLWRAVVPVQFLCAVSRQAALPASSAVNNGTNSRAVHASTGAVSPRPTLTDLHAPES